MDLEFDVVELPAAKHPEVGATAPDFTRPLVTRESWEDVQLSELTATGPVLLVFYPMDGAFPATYIWNELRDRGFDQYAPAVVGLSISTPYEHKSFIDDRQLEGTGFRFYADPANEVAEQYGIVNDLDGMAGIAEPRPATFLLAEDRTIQYAWVAEQWPEFPPYDDLESAVAAIEAET